MALVGAQFVNAVSPNPVGSLQAYAGESAPTGWLLCDGSQQAISTYPELYSVLGTTYGALTNGLGGAGTTHFRVPDLRGRMPIGAGNEGVAANNTPTGRALGTKGGDTRMQSHTHTSSVGSGNFAVPNMGIGWANSAPAAGWNPSNLIGSLNNAGSGGAENMPPFLVTNYIIKAVPDLPRSGLQVGGTPPIVTALPANPQFGEVVTYAADATNGIYWTLQYDASGTYPWKFIGGPPLVDTVSTMQATSSSAYTGLTTAGPQITCTLEGDYDVLIGCGINGGAVADVVGVMSYKVGSTAASDADAAWMQTRGPGFEFTTAKTSRKTAVPASTLLLAQYKAPGSASMTFGNRYMRVTPVRVKAG